VFEANVVLFHRKRKTQNSLVCSVQPLSMQD